MAQSRVTRFFPQRKKSSIEAAAQRKGGRKNPDTQPSAICVFGDNGDSAASPSKDGSKTLSPRCSNSVHRDFVRNVVAATGADREDAQVDVLFDPDPKMPASPVTPKRTSTDADLGCLTSATSDHSTAKKRRHVNPAKNTQEGHQSERKTARKKLILQKDEAVGISRTFTPYVLLRMFIRRYLRPIPARCL